jgi:hypothetical protein
MLRSVIEKISPARGLRILASAWVLTTVGTLALIATASAAGAAPPCQLATLNGTYAFSYVSWLYNSQSGGGVSMQPFSQGGFHTFDGNGNG